MRQFPIFFTPDASGDPAPKPKQVHGPFDKATMAALDEATEVADNAQKAPYAAILATKYGITTPQIVALVEKIARCEGLFGNARTSELGAQTQTVNKDDAKDAIIEAIDEFRTGARLSLKTAAALKDFGVGVNLEKNASVLAQLAQSILDNPLSPTLRGISSDEMMALQNALDDWKASGGAQLSGGAQGQGERARAEALFEEIEAEVREIKIAIDGKFSYKNSVNVDARKLFHLPLKRPYAPKMSD